MHKIYKNFRQSVARYCAKNPVTKLPFQAYIRFMNKRRYEAFSTASKDLIPILKKLFERVKNLEGDYYEFGLYKGYIFYLAHKYAEELNIKDIQFFGFDSFEGLPPAEGIDAGWRFKEGDYAYPIEKVKANLTKKGIDWKNTHLIKGYYEESLKNPEGTFRKARIVLIDCDLYSSTVPVLKFIEPYLQVGTILIFDDWNCFDSDDNKGQRKAMREFMTRHPAFQMKELGSFGWHGIYFEVTQV